MKKTTSLVLVLVLGLAVEVANVEFSFGTPTPVPIIKSWSKGQIRKDALLSVMEQMDLDCGICVVLGDMGCELALDLAKSMEGLTIYVQLPTMEEVEVASKQIDHDGLYGTHIFIEKGDLYRIHLAENLADVVIGLGQGTDVPEEEVLRVLRPQGKAILGDTILTKPFANGVDDWSHPYHGPDNNPQSNDRIIRAPYLTQFLAEPRYAPLPQVAVASAGRVFKAFGHVAFKTREEPFLNKLVAFNGYNGTMLWQRDLAEGVMIHRNTMIATPATLYVGDDKSCKLIDTLTGQLKDEIIPPPEIAGRTFWKWMALEDGILYALLGEAEQMDETMRWKRQTHGWPWSAISTGFTQFENPWGFGRNVLAIDPVTKKVLWSHREEQPIDGRAICMKNGRIYIFRFGDYLACLDAQDGHNVWRKTANRTHNKPTSSLFESLGAYSNRQGYSTNWRTTSYLKCSDRALYFAGPQVNKLLAISTEDGNILWEHPYNNFQLVLRDDGLYGISGPWGNNVSKKFDPLTGEILAELPTGRRACTRPTGTSDSILFRAAGGSVRLDLATHRSCWISPMRPSCHDGVTIANGLLYWWPSVCDCQLTLYGVTCLGPAGDFDFAAPALEIDRLETEQSDPADTEPLTESSADWPTFRANNQRTATTEAVVPGEVHLLWQYDIGTERAAGAPPFTAPVAAGGLIFVSGPDGIIHAVEAEMGTLRWKAYTAGAIRIPPTIWEGRALVGSGDGWVYCFEATTGRRLWRFRAAPAERKIPVYGALLSTWPASSGVLVEDGIAYVAAGIVNYDGTYVYALDAATGEIKWQNVTAGHLDPDAKTGVSVQGHLLLHDGKLYLAGGTSISPAIFDISDGACLNDPKPLADCISRSPRGWELSLIAGQVVACGKPFYAHPEYEVYDSSVFERVFWASSGDYDFVWTSEWVQSRIMCYYQIDKKNPLWTYSCPNSKAWAVCPNAVVVATNSMVLALNPTTGHILWSHPLPTSPVTWGMAVDREGRIVLTLEDGQVLCLERVPQPDINGNGEVNLEDLAVMASQWRQGPTTPSVDIGPTSTGDGVVDFQDIAVLTEYWLTYPGTVAHWKLDETEGSAVYDSAGETDGILHNDPVWHATDGKVDGALELDGIDDYISTPFVLNPADGSFGIFAWIRGGAPGQVILSQISALNWLLADSVDGKLMTELRDSGRFGGALLSQIVITDGQWHRIGLVWDGLHRTLYVDDVKAAEDTQANLQDSDGGLYIGTGKNLDSGTFFSGLIDDIRIYNRAVHP
jgi:outer membrane protein assembly factor BamB